MTRWATAGHVARATAIVEPFTNSRLMPSRDEAATEGSDSDYLHTVMGCERSSPDDPGPATSSSSRAKSFGRRAPRGHRAPSAWTDDPGTTLIVSGSTSLTFGQAAVLEHSKLRMRKQRKYGSEGQRSIGHRA